MHLTEQVTGDLFRVPLSLVNVYLWGPPGAGDRGWVLIDAGLSVSAATLVAAAAERFGATSRPAAIVLTHGHFDHVGTLPALADRWQAPIFAHPLELPYLTGKSAYPPPDPSVGGGAMSLLSRLYARGPFDFGDRVRPLPESGAVPAMPGWRWVHTPGHTPGHVALFRDSDRVLIAGDAFVTAKQESMLGALTRWPGEVRRPPAYFTPDWEAAGQSVAKLAALKPEIGATGHGFVVQGEKLRRGLGRLAAHWQELAVPSHGRYVGRPAVADERGVVSVPPPVWDRQALALGGAGAAVAAGLMLRRSRA